MSLVSGRSTQPTSPKPCNSSWQAMPAAGEINSDRDDLEDRMDRRGHGGSETKITKEGAQEYLQRRSGDTETDAVSVALDSTARQDGDKDASALPQGAKADSAPPQKPDPDEAVKGSAPAAASASRSSSKATIAATHDTTASDYAARQRQQTQLTPPGAIGGSSSSGGGGKNDAQQNGQESQKLSSDKAPTPAPRGMVPDNEDDEEEASGRSTVRRQHALQNYASRDSGATMLESSPGSKGMANLLIDDKDKYAISPCEDRQWAVFGLSEDILVRTIKISSHEKYSSLVKDFQVLASQTYPVNEWLDLGTFRAKSVQGEQTFDLPQSAFARYLKFKFLSHYGDEFYCTLSQVRVHGSTMLESFQHEWQQSSAEVRKVQDMMKKDAKPAAASSGGSHAAAGPTGSVLNRGKGRTGVGDVEPAPTPGDAPRPPTGPSIAKGMPLNDGGADHRPHAASAATVSTVKRPGSGVAGASASASVGSGTVPVEEIVRGVPAEMVVPVADTCVGPAGADGTCLGEGLGDGGSDVKVTPGSSASTPLSTEVPSMAKEGGADGHDVVGGGGDTPVSEGPATDKQPADASGLSAGQVEDRDSSAQSRGQGGTTKAGDSATDRSKRGPPEAKASAASESTTVGNEVVEGGGVGEELDYRAVNAGETLVTRGQNVRDEGGGHGDDGHPPPRKGIIHSTMEAISKAVHRGEGGRAKDDSSATPQGPSQPSIGDVAVDSAGETVNTKPAGAGGDSSSDPSPAQPPPECGGGAVEDSDEVDGCFSSMRDEASSHVSGQDKVAMLGGSDERPDAARARVKEEAASRTGEDGAGTEVKGLLENRTGTAHDPRAHVHKHAEVGSETEGPPSNSAAQGGGAPEQGLQEPASSPSEADTRTNSGPSPPASATCLPAANPEVTTGRGECVNVNKVDGEAETGKGRGASAAKETASMQTPSDHEETRERMETSASAREPSHASEKEDTSSSAPGVVPASDGSETTAAVVGGEAAQGVPVVTAAEETHPAALAAACLDRLSFSDFREEVLSRTQHAQQSAGGGVTIAGQYESIFKTLMNKIKTLEINQSLFSLYIDDVHTCYQDIIGQLLREQEMARASRSELLDTQTAHLVRTSDQWPAFEGLQEKVLEMESRMLLCSMAWFTSLFCLFILILRCCVKACRQIAGVGGSGGCDTVARKERPRACGQSGHEHHRTNWSLACDGTAPGGARVESMFRDCNSPPSWNVRKTIDGADCGGGRTNTPGGAGQCTSRGTVSAWPTLDPALSATMAKSNSSGVARCSGCGDVPLGVSTDVGDGLLEKRRW